MTREVDPSSTRFSLVSLSIALAIVGITAANESLPLIFGTGYQATCDWAFPYITLKLILLPLSSFVLVCAVVVTAIRRRHATVGSLIAVVIGASYLVALYFWPLPWLP